MYKLNLIAIVAIVAAFAVSTLVVGSVFAQNNTSIPNANVSTMGTGMNGTSGMPNSTLSMPSGMTSNASSASSTASP